MHIGKNVGWIVKNTPLRAEQLLRDDPHNLQMHVVIVQLAFECANCVATRSLHPRTALHNTTFSR